ncbi:MAG: site-specific integrase [Carboxylicivirga sp.]|jgi:integrase|nr:site-specific integrase [Carboxylicivirga sp.]
MIRNIPFYIAKGRTDKRGLAPIYAQVRIKAKNYPIQVEKIKPRYWNAKKQRVNKPKEHEPDNQFQKVNELLNSLNSNTSRFDRFESYLTPPSREEVKAVLLNVNSSSKNFQEAYTEFIESNRNKVAYNTTRGRVTAKQFIEKYQKDKSLIIQFKDIDLQLFDKLHDYAYEELDLETNTFVSYVAKFKAFLNWANDKGYCEGQEHRRYSCSEKEKNVICLTPEEFKALYNHTFKSKRLERARDLYCFGCLTGLRYSDIKSLRYEHIIGDFIHKNITKTKEDDLIPILPQARSILDKYKDESFYPLPRMSNQKLNDNIKECCEEVKINTPTIKVKYQGNKRVETVHPKYKLITVHTARKTFITIGFIKGLDVKIIKSITGHKKDSTFDKYLKIADEHKKVKLLEAWSGIE